MIIMIKLNKFLKNNTAVSEVVGTILLIVISVSLFSVVYASFFAFELGDSTPSVNIASSIQDKNLTLYHSGGNSLSNNSKVFLMSESNARVNFSIKNLNSWDDNGNNRWDIGERIVCELDPGLGFNRYEELFIQVVDLETGSTVMMATVKESRISDLKLNVTKERIGGSNKWWINTTVKNLGPSEAENVVIQQKLPAGFELEEAEGDGAELYQASLSGRWNVGILGENEFKELSLKVSVSPAIQPTQLVIILDGTVPQAKWDKIVEGLKLSVQNSVIPHDGTVEITVIQYGSRQLIDGYVPTARIEIGPCIIEDCSSVITCASCCDCYTCVGIGIENIQRMGGWGTVPDGSSYPEMFVVPMSSGFKKAVDSIKTTDLPQVDRQVVILMASNIPNCYIPAGEEGADATAIPLDIYTNYGIDITILPGWHNYNYIYSPGKSDALAKRNELLEIMTLGKPLAQHEINVAVFNKIKEESEAYAAPPWPFTTKEDDWFSNFIPFPQPSINLTSETKEPEEYGWYRLIEDNNDIVSSIQSMYSQIFRVQDNTMQIEIISTKYMDPNPEDNKVIVSISSLNEEGK